jgi:hypothetical protein
VCLTPAGPLTNLWLMPLLGTGEALRWTRHSGWVVTNPGRYLPEQDGTDAALGPGRCLVSDALSAGSSETDNRGSLIQDAGPGGTRTPGTGG